MYIRYFQYVIEISRCGSINKAAQNLNLSQPNLSTCIKKLEEELGFQVFSRKNSGIELTPEGKMLLRSAEVILREVEKVRHIPDAFAENRNLSIVCTYSGLLMQSFIDFKMAHPRGVLQDSFKETGVIRSLMDVVEHQYRMSIIYCFSSTVHNQRARAEQYNLAMTRLAQDIPVMAMVGRNGPLSGKKSIRYEDLGRYPIATFENFDYDDWLGPLGINSTNNVLFVFDRGGLVDTVKTSPYIAVVMAGTPPRDVLTLPIEGFDERLELYLLYPQSYQMNPREKQLVQFLKQNVREMLSIYR